VDLCTECAQEFGLPDRLDAVELAGLEDRERKLEEFLGNVTRYSREAYEFVCEALEICIGSPAKGPVNQLIRHSDATELLEAIRHLARKQFGKEAKAVLRGWKAFRTEDFGEIVFEMVDAGLLLKTPEDSKEDFKDGYSFDETFPEA